MLIRFVESHMYHLNKEKKMANQKKTLRITKQVVNQKRHVIGYVVNGETLTRGVVVKLARRNQISGVEARRSSARTKWYVKATNGRALSTLPEVLA